MPKKIDNSFYNDLEEKWYVCQDHPVALLRAENEARFPWIQKKIELMYGNHSCEILDIGCGGGYLANTLAQDGHKVTGVDLSETSLKIAQEKDLTKTVNYIKADAYELPFLPESFDIICSMDFLEHVEYPEKIIAKTSQLLRKGGLFFFHTFNRNIFSYLFVIKGVEWCVRNTPKNMHLYRLFIKPEEIKQMLKTNELTFLDIVGLSPQVKSYAFLKMLVTRKVPSSLHFKIHQSLTTGYLGVAKKS